MKHLAVALLITVGTLTAAAAQAEEQHRPRVLIDRSHEWLLGWMTLADEVLCPNGLDVTMRDCSFGAGTGLSDGDVLFVGQIGSGVPFSPSELELLTRYVSDGGVLFLYGEPRQPIAEAARYFGLGFTERRVAVPFVTGPDLRRLGAPDRIPAAAADVPYAMTAPPNARVLVSGQDGEPLAVEVSCGRGRVVCVLAHGWDLGAGDAAQRRAVRAGMLALFRVCLGSRQPLPGRGAISQVNSENVLELPELPGWVVDYPSTIESDAKPLLALLPKIGRAVQRYNGVLPRGGQFCVGLIATDAGGVAGPGFVCVQAKGALGDNIAVAGHEYTHQLAGALPSILAEGWASEVGNRVRREMGYPRDPRPEHQLNLEAYRQQDPAGNAVDICQEPADSPPGFFAREAKLMWMVGELEQRYGADFMVRFLDLLRAAEAPHCPTVSQVLDYFSVVAGEDLGGWYRELGLHPATAARPSREEMDRRLAAFRVTRELHGEDARLLNGYLANPAPFRGDEWRNAWRIDASLYGTDKFWVDDLRQPQYPLGFLTRRDVGTRRGFWVFQAPTSDKVGRLTSTATVPAQGRTTLYLGFARRDGGESVMRLKADGKCIWERDLDCDGWWHVPISLTDFAGHRVRLELETDTTKGQWNCREVLIDYLTIVTEARG